MGPPKVCSPAKRNGQADRPGSPGSLAGARPWPPMQAEAQTPLLVVQTRKESVIPALALRLTDLARKLAQPSLLVPVRELCQELRQLAFLRTKRRFYQNLGHPVNQRAVRPQLGEHRPAVRGDAAVGSSI